MHPHPLALRYPDLIRRLDGLALPYIPDQVRDDDMRRYGECRAAQSVAPREGGGDEPKQPKPIVNLSNPIRNHGIA